MPVTTAPAPSASTSAASRPLRLVVIVGSVREGRFGPTVADWFLKEAVEHAGFEVDTVDLAEAEFAPLVSTPTYAGELTPAADRVRGALSARLAAADAFVVVTPEYNHSFPGALKNTIDWFGDEWYAKPVGLVSYGGMAGGQRAAEHLRSVFAELHAVTVRETLSFVDAWSRFDEHGLPQDRAGTSAAAVSLLVQLEWWASALREARDRTPYTAD
ncbi:NADPH-dependent FMN reductase [Streptomyces xiaopingdaonensis]|uniref:NADPH-dependent FMN reductase n=1 Tax=Streptomyces xiaopingdaonensis TaxID=1565415 RepID=UPI00030A74D1|nr:NAD(P)H-dependent oxidoreductase [Streptomyces xiaopingdaonensis]